VIHTLLPEPPASILVAGFGGGPYIRFLEQTGYEVHLLDLLDRGLASAKAYHSVLLMGNFKAYSSISYALEKVRALLRPEGTLIVCDEVCYDSASHKGKTGVHPYTGLISALFENGFSIRSDGETEENILQIHNKLAGQASEVFDPPNHAVGHERLLDFKDPKKDLYGKRQTGWRILVARKERIFVRAYMKSDETVILPMFRKVFKADRTLEHWYWKFRDNPFGAHKIAEAFTEDGALAAQYSGYPVPFSSSVGGREEFVSFQIGDIMTGPEVRNIGRGMSSVLSRVAVYFYNKFCINKVPFMYGFVAGNHKKFGERFLGYQYMSQVPYHVLDLTSYRQAHTGRIRRFLSGLSIKRETQITGEYDALFDQVCRDYGLLVTRRSGYLKWRYIDCPDNVHRVYGVRRFGKLIGWGVFSVRGDVLIWGDALFNKRYPEAAGFMLERIVKRDYPHVSKVEGWFSPLPGWWGDLLGDIGFQATGEPNGLVSGVRLFDSLFSIELVKGNLYYTMGDSDLF
jgi:hypothetical protein